MHDREELGTRGYRHESQQKVMHLDTHEFIRRFLLHVLPNGLQRIRHYGFLANRYRAIKLTHCRELLAEPEPIVGRSRYAEKPPE